MLVLQDERLAFPHTDGSTAPSFDGHHRFFMPICDRGAPVGCLSPGRMQLAIVVTPDNAAALQVEGYPPKRVRPCASSAVLSGKRIRSVVMAVDASMLHSGSGCAWRHPTGTRRILGRTRLGHHLLGGVPRGPRQWSIESHRASSGPLSADADESTQAARGTEWR